MPPIATEKYVRLTTFTKDGRRKESPVWIAEVGDGRVGFTTEVDSWKVKRIRNTPGVELAPSNMKGKVEPGTETVTGTATIVREDEAAATAAAIKAKYGFQVTMIRAIGSIKARFGRGDDTPCAVVITLD
ncbi:MAG: PPOX class F420-dependent oxidoreductase [Acidimicrobiales bacterium]|nr:MAG: PPOX class F420-dependent oxidoreductase [Acidimicrobiales bacterium]